MRVHLRQYDDADFPALHALLSQEAISDYVNVPRPPTAEDARDYIAARTTGKSRTVSILLEDKPIGFLTYGNFGQPDIYQLSYFIDPAFGGRSAATVAVGLVADQLMKEHGCVRLHASVEPRNAASCRVLEKNGFEREGLLRKFHRQRDALVDVYMYAKIKEET